MMTIFAAYTGSFHDYLHLFRTGQVHFGSWFEHVNGWYSYAQDHPNNVLLLRYEEMKQNLKYQVKRIAAFLDLSVSEALVDEVCAKSTFKAMQNNSLANGEWIPQVENKPKHLRKGMVGDWKNYFTIAENEDFDHLIATQLDPTIPPYRYE